jgi:hypothetical protein
MERDSTRTARTTRTRGRPFTRGDARANPGGVPRHLRGLHDLSRETRLRVLREIARELRRLEAVIVILAPDLADDEIARLYRP